MVVNEDDVKFAGIVLAEKRGNGFGDVFGFVASGNNGDDALPVRGRSVRGKVVVEGAEAPEEAAKEGEIEPDQKRERGESQRERRHALFCNRDAGGS